MVNALYVYDIIFLLVFTLIAVVFLYRKKHNLRKEGIMYLYPTQIGVKLIDKFAKKYSRLLKFTEYIVLVSGYLLMITVIYGVMKLAIGYVTSPTLASELRVPVIIPLIPYLPELFHIDFLPPFYFTYWILIITILAIPHEFAHGIFARLHGIKVHSTGFGFLGPFLAAFVEPDEKQMAKAKIKNQLSILASGTFANVLLTIFFAVLIWIFFSLSFNPGGVYYSPYIIEQIPQSQIESFNGLSAFAILSTSLSENDVVSVNLKNNQTYLTSFRSLANSLINNLPVIAYQKTPIIASNVSGPITSFNSVSVSSYDNLRDQILLL